MRKLNILKSLVDYVWIITCIPSIIVIPILCVVIFMEPNIMEYTQDIKIPVTETGLIWPKSVGIFFLLVLYLPIYSLYLFRKNLRKFQEGKPFDNSVILNFQRIGSILVATGAILLLLYLFYQFIILDIVKITFGFTSRIGIICLGLFFMVLSEIFKVAKNAKEENELTV